MTNAVFFIVVLGVLITVHELGHFLVAKAIGLGVERFSIGFPPKMLGFTLGETEYCLSWIPLGGYVKLKGENPDEADQDIGDPKHFMSRPPYQRAGVLAAGPLMNLIFAFLLMPLVFLLGENIPAYFEKSPVIGWVESGSPADAAGVNTGERVLTVDGEKVLTWESLSEKVPFNGVVELTLGDSGSVRSVTLDMSREKDGRLGIYPQIEPVVGSLTPGYPAGQAGIHEGDRIRSVGGVPVSHWLEVAGIIHASPEKPITFTVDRGGEEIEISVVPKLDERSGYGLIGISPKVDILKRKSGFSDALRKGTDENLYLINRTLTFLGELLTFKSSITNLGGPIMIFQATGQVAKEGLSQFIWFMAFLSLQLGILNLFPIPVLDGGHILFLAVESVKRRPVNLKVRENAQKVGFFLLLLLIIIVSYNDIIRLITSR